MSHSVRIVLRLVVIAAAVLLGAASVAGFRARGFLKRSESAAGNRQWGEARELAGLALRWDPWLGEAFYYRGVAAAGLGNINAAREDLSRAAALVGNPAPAWLTLGDILAQSGRQDEALALLDSALTANPWPMMQPERYWSLLAECRLASGMDAASGIAPLWMAWITSDYHPSRAISLIGEYERLGDGTEHIIPDALALGVARAGMPSSALKERILLRFERAGRKDLSADFMRGLIAEGRAVSRDYLALAMYQLDLGEPLQALETLQIAPEDLRQEPLYHYTLGRAADDLGDRDTMRTAYERYLALSPFAPNRAAIEARLNSLP